MKELLQHPVTRGAIAGAVAAAAVDIQAFRNWKTIHDWLEYDWGIAAWRWFQGAALGALTAFGIGGVA